SGVGGIISNIALIFIAPLLAAVALKFSAPEYFALAIFGLSIISSISGDSIIKGLIGGSIGLLIATIVLDPVSGLPRFTFDTTTLLGGVDFIPILIGLFAFAQTLISIEESYGQKAKKYASKIKGFFPSKSDVKKTSPTMIRSGIIG